MSQLTISSVLIGAAAEPAAQLTTPVAYPANVKPGMLLAVSGSLFSASATGITTPTGWAQKFQFANTGSTTTPSLWLATKIADVADAAASAAGGTLAVAHGNVVGMFGMIAVPNADTSTIWDTTPTQSLYDSNNSSAAQAAVPGLTVQTAGSMALFLAACRSAVTTSTPPAGYTELWDRNTGTRGFTAAYKLGLSTGATGTVQNSWGAPSQTDGALVIIRPGQTHITHGIWNGSSWDPAGPSVWNGSAWL